MFDFTVHPVHPNLKHCVKMFCVLHLNQRETMNILTPAKTESVLMFHIGSNTNDMIAYYNFPNDVPKVFSFYKDESWIGGMLNQPLNMLVSGSTRILCVILTPYGLHHLIKESATSILNAGYSLDSLGLQKHFARLTDTLRQTDCSEKAFLLVENQLLNYFNPLDIPFSIKDVSPVVDYISQRNGIVKIKELEEKFRTSRRWLEKQFIEQVGVSPKEFARIKRFSAILEEAMKPPSRNNRDVPSVSRATTSVSWARLLNDYGYYDHSHLIKDFKDFTGQLPNQYIKSNNPHGVNNLFLKSIE